MIFPHSLASFYELQIELHSLIFEMVKNLVKNKIKILDKKQKLPIAGKR